MREKAKELQRQRLETIKQGGKGGRSGGYSMSSSNFNSVSGPTAVQDSSVPPSEPSRPSYS
jgi:hypothetical protein